MKQNLVVSALCITAALVALGIYRDVVDHEFVWDDPIFLEKQLPHLDSASKAFAPPAGIPQFARHYYRPLILLSYQADVALSRRLGAPTEQLEARRRVLHTSPLLFHALATTLVLLLGLALYRATGPASTPSAGLFAATSGALLFALHPIHVESVAWMAGRSDVLCGVFFFGSAACYLSYRRMASGPLRGLSGLGCLLLALAAMLAKETGLGLLLFLPAIDLVLRRGGAGIPSGRIPSRGDLALAWGALAAVAVFYAVLRSGALQASGGAMLPPAGQIPPFRAIFGALAWYLAKVLWPPPQSAFVAEVPSSLAAALGFVGSLVLAGLGGLALALPRLASWRRELLCGVLFFSSLAPSLAIALGRISETPLAERYLYLPSAGACLLVGLLFERLLALGPRVAGLRTGAIAALATLAALGIGAGWLTQQRVGVWSTDLALWTDTVDRAPSHALPHFQLGLALQKRARYDDAELEFREALERYDDAEGRSLASASLGTLHMQRGEIEPAIRRLDEALRHDPNYASAYFNRAVCYRQLAQRSQSVDRQRHLARTFEDLKRALYLNPNYPLAHLEYGELLLMTGQRTDGIAHLREVIRLAPRSARAEEARRMLGTLGVDPGAAPGAGD